MTNEADATPIEIGDAQPGDVDRLTTLFLADMDDLGRTPNAEEMRALTSKLVERDGDDAVLRVARDPTGLIVGVLLATQMWSIKFPGRALWIEEVYVVPEFRRAGIGRQLVENLLAWAAERDVRGIELEAYRMNTAASILYRTLGFRRLARERYSFDMDEYLPPGEAADASYGP